MDDCVFCKIIKGEIPSKKLYEDDEFLIFDNIAPKAKQHYLAIVKEHFGTLAEMNDSQAVLLGKLMQKIGELRERLGLLHGYKLVINQIGELGNDAHQSVMHVHIHILAGEDLGE